MFGNGTFVFPLKRTKTDALYLRFFPFNGKKKNRHNLVPAISFSYFTARTNNLVDVSKVQLAFKNSIISMGRAHVKHSRAKNRSHRKLYNQENRRTIACKKKTDASFESQTVVSIQIFFQNPGGGFLKVCLASPRGSF